MARRNPHARQTPPRNALLRLALHVRQTLRLLHAPDPHALHDLRLTVPHDRHRDQAASWRHPAFLGHDILLQKPLNPTTRPRHADARRLQDRQPRLPRHPPESHRHPGLGTRHDRPPARRPSEPDDAVRAGGVGPEHRVGGGQRQRECLLGGWDCARSAAAGDAGALVRRRERVRRRAGSGVGAGVQRAEGRGHHAGHRGAVCVETGEWGHGEALCRDDASVWGGDLGDG